MRNGDNTSGDARTVAIRALFFKLLDETDSATCANFCSALPIDVQEVIFEAAQHGHPDTATKMALRAAIREAKEGKG